MRRWNGWGDDTRDYPVPPALAELLADRIGAGQPPDDVSLATAVRQVPPSRLPEGAGPVGSLGEIAGLLSSDPADRLLHARGQSFPDLVAMRSGQLGAVPDVVAHPRSGSDVRALIDAARSIEAQVIPYGGGTSVVGGVTATASDAPVLTVDLAGVSGLSRLNRRDQLATFGAGVTGPRLEALLRADGLTLGHFPQSFELSTLGGWVATRSSGQQSLGFGRIERLFAGGVVECPAGTLELPTFPASAAGPDLRELVLGSEGRLGIITEATVRVRPVPETDDVYAVFLPSWDAALEATREIVQEGIPLSMLRLSTAEEAATQRTLAGDSRAAVVLDKGLAVRGVGAGRCVLLIGVMGTAALARQRWRSAYGVARRHGGVQVGRSLGRRWQRGRFRAPYLRNGLWERGFGIDTVETATTWTQLPTMLARLEQDIGAALEPVGERVHVVTHLSHVYPTGSSIYTTYAFRLGATADETMERWSRCKTAASEAIVAIGGTISHQHGVGLDHRDYLPAEKGELGMAALRSLAGSLDPDGRMNPGKLLA
jgi:alkyldihydroxyacetonephosphate synthase